MTRTLEVFRKEELDEVFSHPPIREVAFEIRFAPRLRVNAELWRLQDELVEEYPNVGTEQILFQPGGPMLNVSVFQNPAAGRVIKVSQENFVVAFTRYTRFEDFKEEVIAKAEQFCKTYDVTNVTRVGLRYVNNIVLPAADETAVLLRFVRPLIDLERVDIDSVEQFLTEVRMRYKNHLATIRGVLLAQLEDGRRIYVLDIDCHNHVPEVAGHIPHLLDAYHDTSQRFFLDHVSDEFKNVMRGKR